MGTGGGWQVVEVDEPRRAQEQAASPMTVELFRPSLDDLHVRQAWLADPAMMAYNAGWRIPHPGYDDDTGCIHEPETAWPAFLARYSDAASAGYFYLRERSSGEFVGHVHHRMTSPDRAEIGVNIVPARRREGLGLAGLRLLLDRIWTTTQAREAYNTFEDERTGAVRLHLAAGFRPAEVTVVAGRPVRVWTLARPADDGGSPR